MIDEDFQGDFLSTLHVAMGRTEMLVASYTEGNLTHDKLSNNLIHARDAVSHLESTVKNSKYYQTSREMQDIADDDLARLKSLLDECTQYIPPEKEFDPELFVRLSVAQHLIYIITERYRIFEVEVLGEEVTEFQRAVREGREIVAEKEAEQRQQLGEQLLAYVANHSHLRGLAQGLHGRYQQGRADASPFNRKPSTN